jgi:hypothetical protein
MANALIPLGFKPFDFANSFHSGIKTANALFGEPLSAKEEAALEMAQQRADQAQANSDRSFGAAEAHRKWQRENAAADDARAAKGNAYERVRTKIEQGIPLTAGEQAIQELMKSDPLGGFGGSGAPPGDIDGLPGPGGAPAPSPAPAAPAASEAPVSQLPPLNMIGGASPAAANVQRQSPAPAAPSIPPALAGRPGLQWSPSKQMWRDAEGNIFNQQGIPSG